MMAANGRKQRPVFSKRYFPVEIAVFEHENDGGRTNHSIKLTRTFRRDEESEWEQHSEGNHPSFQSSLVGHIISSLFAHDEIHNA